MGATKPDYIKQLTGNPGKRELNPNPPAFRMDRPAAPEFLVGEALDCWVRMADLLDEAKLLGLISRDRLARYCQAWADWVDVVKERNSMTVEKRMRPDALNFRTHIHLNRVRADAEQVMASFEKEYGLTPAAASRVRLRTETPVSEFDAFMAEKIEDAEGNSDERSSG